MKRSVGGRPMQGEKFFLLGFRLASVSFADQGSGHGGVRSRSSAPASTGPRARHLDAYRNTCAAQATSSGGPGQLHDHFHLDILVSFLRACLAFLGMLLRTPPPSLPGSWDRRWPATMAVGGRSRVDVVA